MQPGPAKRAPTVRGEGFRAGGGSLLLYFARTLPLTLHCPLLFWAGSLSGLESEPELSLEWDTPGCSCPDDTHVILSSGDALSQMPFCQSQQLTWGHVGRALRKTRVKGPWLPAPGTRGSSPSCSCGSRCQQSHWCFSPIQREGDWPKVTQLGRGNTRPRIQVSCLPSLSERSEAAERERPFLLRHYYPL